MGKRTHTHTGTCQACGRSEVAVDISNGRLAKHGYTRKYHFFSGTCPGSDKLPAQKSVEFTKTIIKSCIAAMLQCRERAKQLETEVIETYLEETSRYVGGRSVRAHDTLKFADAPAWKQRQVRQRLINEQLGTARANESHADMLTKFVLPMFGKELVKVIVIERQKAAVGVQFKMWDADWTVLEIKEQVTRGVGPHVNGRVLPHATIKRTSDGYTRTVLARQVNRYL